MAKKNTQQPQEQFKTMIGGQALIEGIMMLGPEKSAVVVRTKDGLQRKVEPRKLSQKWSPKKLPFIRGIFNFCTSMKTGVPPSCIPRISLRRRTRTKRQGARPF